jgi:zinc/manganese transport system substrate-binding protein
MKTLSAIGFFILLILSFPARALNVFACEPEWASLAQELGGAKVSAFAATTAKQDPHRIEARPSLIARMRAADLVICSGADLEAGWLPLLFTQAGNAHVQPGTPGYLEASRVVPRLEVPASLDRALGDIHPSGNPHVHLDPRNIARVAVVLSQRLSQLDAPNREYYANRAADFAARWQAALQRWEPRAAALKGVPVVVYHKDLSYFLNWTGMLEAGSLEPKPGIAPSPAHLAELVEQMKRSPAKLIAYSAYNSSQAAEFLSERTRIPSVVLPFTVGGTSEAKDLFGLFDDTLARLEKALR